MVSISFRDPGEPFFCKAKKMAHRRNPSKRFISAEIEVGQYQDASRINAVTRRRAHAVVRDNSHVGDYSVAFEVCTAPATGDLFVEHIEELCEAFVDGGARTNPACGLHIHVDARDFGYWDIQRLVRVYAAIEPALFAMVSPDRATNPYCLPCGRGYLQGFANKGPKEAFAKSCYGIQTKDLRGQRDYKYHQCRYRALNLHSWFYRGTIESRHRHGTVAAEDIWMWGVLWASILDWANRSSDRVLKAMSSDPREVLLGIVPNDTIRRYVLSLLS